MKIICAGLSKTGTKSCSAALRKLGQDKMPDSCYLIHALNALHSPKKFNHDYKLSMDHGKKRI